MIIYLIGLAVAAALLWSAFHVGKNAPLAPDFFCQHEWKPLDGERKWERCSRCEGERRVL